VGWAFRSAVIVVHTVPGEPRYDLPVRRKIDEEGAAFMYRDGMTLAEIADVFGVTRQAVHLALVRVGVPRRPRGTRSSLEERFATVERLQAVELANRLGLQRAAQHLGVPRSLLKSWGAVGRHAPPLRLSDSQIAARYAAGESSVQLAKELGTYAERIMRIARKYGVARTRSEAGALAAPLISASRRARRP
jgi:hypothetical protein